MSYYHSEKGEKYIDKRKKKISQLEVDSEDKPKDQLTDEEINGMLEYLDEQYHVKSLVREEELKKRIKELKGNMLDICNYVEEEILII